MVLIIRDPLVVAVGGRGTVCCVADGGGVTMFVSCVYILDSYNHLQAFGLTMQQMQQIDNSSVHAKQHRRNISSPEQVVQSIREEVEKSE